MYFQGFPVHFYTVLNTDEIYDLLEQKRLSLGLSQAEVGGLAFGKADNSAFQSIRRGASPSVHRLHALAKALGLELYFGPSKSDDERIAPLLGFAESRAVLDEKVSLPEEDRLFLPIPFGRANGHKHGVGPIAFMQEWFDQLGCPPDNLTFAEITGATMYPIITPGSLALVDSASIDYQEFSRDVVFAVSYDGGCFAHNIAKASGDLIVLTHHNTELPAMVCSQKQLNTTHRILGQIVWSGRAWLDSR